MPLSAKEAVEKGLEVGQYPCGHGGGDTRGLRINVHRFAHGVPPSGPEYCSYKDWIASVSLDHVFFAGKDS